jgi:hypothetical protein
LSSSSRARGEHDDRHLARRRVLLEQAGQLQSAHVREHPVHEHEVREAVRDLDSRGAAVFRLADFEPGSPQPERDHVAYRLFILDDQYLLGGHGEFQFCDDDITAMPRYRFIKPAHDRGCGAAWLRLA